MQNEKQYFFESSEGYKLPHFKFDGVGRDEKKASLISLAKQLLANAIIAKKKNYTYS